MRYGLRYIAKDEAGEVWLFETTQARGRTRHDRKIVAQHESDIGAWSQVVDLYGKN